MSGCPRCSLSLCDCWLKYGYSYLKKLYDEREELTKNVENNQKMSELPYDIYQVEKERLERFLESESCRALKSQYQFWDAERTEK